MKNTTFIALGVAAFFGLANTVTAQEAAAPLKAHNQFVMSSKVTSKDYVAKTIIFKLKPQYRSVASLSYIQDTKLQIVLNYLGVDKMAKIYPHHQPPVEKYNSLHQEYADLSLIYELKYTNNIDLTKAINQMLATGIMEYAEPHYIYELSTYTPNDPKVTITNSALGQASFLARIRALEAWDLAAGGSQGDTSVVIGIVDSGTDLDHPDLAANFKHNYADPINGVDDDLDGFIDNYTGWDLGGADYNNVVGDNDANVMGVNNEHGSHVSGCASAVTDNGIGVAGVGFNCKLLPVKCAADNDTRGTGGVGYIIAGYDGITYAADHGAQIINCSWGGTGGGSYGQTIIDYATINKNCLVVAAAGNNNLDEKGYPAAYHYVLSVAATKESSDLRASFTSYNYTVDISSPGNNIYATVYNNSYISMSGTSMASPVTAGGAGLVQSKFNYTNMLQVGQRLKATSDYHYAAGPNISGLGNTASNVKDKLGKGRMNLQRALTDPSVSSVVFDNEAIVDNNDNAFIIGDTLYITGDFINYLAPTTNLTASIKAQVGAANLTVIDTTTTLGAISTLSTANNNGDPFRFKINPATPQNTVLTFRVLLVDGTYNDKYFFDVTVNVDYINITINDVFTTITSKGKIGYNQDAQLEGLGFSYMGTNLLYEAGLMIGTSTTAVSDCVRGITGNTADADFFATITANKTVPGVFSEFDVHGRFNDNPATPVQNLDVAHSAYAWSTPGNTKYVIVEYVIKNTGATLSNLFAGIAADWDIDATTSGSNKADFDPTTNMGYVYSTVAGGKFAGIKVLTNTAPPVSYGIDNVAGGGGGVDINDAGDYFNTPDKYTALSTNRLQAGNTAAAGNDVISVVSTGPYTINTGDSVTVAFALIAGDDLNDIQNSADSAQFHYNGQTTGIKGNSAAAAGVSVFPNPGNSNLNFIFNNAKAGNMQITLINSLGQTVQTISKADFGSGFQHVNTDVSNLPEGTYFYRIINNNDKMVVGKIIISK
ncbi:MAG: S8 family serine peptidase [Bacteroidia bacterium]